MLRLLSLAAMLLMLALPATAQPVNDPFNPARLDERELRVLQGALSLTGDYNGLMDGSWDPRSQTALDTWMRREQQRARYSFADLRPLLVDYDHERNSNGWSVQSFGGGLLTFAAPMGLMRSLAPGDTWPTRFTSDQTTLGIRFGEQTQNEMAERHQAQVAASAAQYEPYMVRNPRRWITSIKRDDGVEVYLRSERFGNSWLSLRLRTEAPDRDRFALMAASIRRGAQPSLQIPFGGILMAVLQTTPPPTQPEPQMPPRLATGLYVNNTDILTTTTALASCATPSADGELLDVIARDDFGGLVLLGGGPRSTAWFAIGAPTPEIGDALTARVPRHGRPVLARSATVVAPIYERIGEGYGVIQMDPVPGALGAPVIDARGTLRGIILTGRPASSAGGQGFGYDNGREILAGPRVIAGFLGANGVLYDRTPLVFGTTSAGSTDTATIAISCGAIE